MNNKLGTKAKGIILFTLVMMISLGMLTACAKGSRQDAVDRISSSQSQQKNNDIKKRTAETTEPQETENQDVPAADPDKDTTQEIENNEADKTTQEVENKDAGKDTSEVENKETDKDTPKEENKGADKNIPGEENKDTAGIEQKDNSSANSKENAVGEESKKTTETEQKEADAEKNAEGKAQTGTKTSAADSGKK